MRISARALFKFILLSCFVTFSADVATSIAASGDAESAATQQVSLPPGIGWDAWQPVREQRSGRSMVKGFVPKGQAPATAKVRLVLTQRPKPSFDSPQSILDGIVQTARQQCHEIKAKRLSSSPGEVIFELRGFGCAGQVGERYLLQRIAFVAQWEIVATYAPMTPMDDLPPQDKRHALELLSSVTINVGGSAANAGWFLISPPRKSDGHFDASAPLPKWKIEEGAGSRDKCERLRTVLNSMAFRQGQASDIEQVKAARCIAMDAPRLENN